MYNLLALSKIFKVFPQHGSSTFTLCILFEHSIYKFNQNSVFISSFQKHCSKISFYSFQKNNRIVIFLKKQLRKVKRYFLKKICDGKSISCSAIPSLHYKYLLLEDNVRLKKKFPTCCLLLE